MFEIGAVTKPQGVRGELRVFPTTDDPSRFALLVGQEITLRTPSGEKLYTLEQARLHKNMVLVKLAGVTDRNMAEHLTKAVILIPEDKALPLAEGEHFVRDLIDLAVETETGEHVGTLTDVLHTNANDVYVISPPEGDAFMIPAIKNVIRHVDIPAGKMVVHLLEGLRELKA